MWDFNEILDQNEKVGGLLRNTTQMENFRRVLHECDLGDMGYSGSKFTWSNKRGTCDFIKERFDRAVATPAWCGQYTEAAVEVLAVAGSDHKPLWLRLRQPTQAPPKLFRFEAC